MSDTTIKHFIISRFFPGQSADYLYNVLAPNFLKMQLPLAKNLFRSLENQTNKNFELVFNTNPKYFDNPKYEFVFKTLQDSTTLPLRFVKPADIPALLKDAYDNYDFVIQTGMDFDDFVFKDAVADTQSKVDECKNILTYGYGKEYIYSKNELYVLRPTERGYLKNNVGYASCFTVMLKSSYAKTLPFIGINQLGHSTVMTKLKEIFEKNNIEFPENVYQRNDSDYGIIYFRHDLSQEHLKGADKAKGKTPLTTANITKKQLEDEFAFTGYELNSIK